MISQLFRKVSNVQVLVNTTSSVSMIVTNIVIGKFLGVEAIGAYGVVAPFLLLIMAVSQVLSTGGQIKCSEELGKQKKDKASGVAGLTLLTAFIFAVLSMIVCFTLYNGLVNLLGADSGTDLHAYSVDYLLGFIIGAPAFIGMLVLIPFIQLNGDKRCVVNAMIGMTVVTCVGDVLAPTVFHAGMFGIGVAGSAGYYCSLIILILHFFGKKAALKPSIKHIEVKRLGGIFTSGIPAALQKVLRTGMSLIINYTLINFVGTIALGIFTVVNNILNLCNSVGQGMGSATLLLSSIFFAEEDKKSLKEVVKAFVKDSLIFNLLMFVIVFIAAEPLVVLFTKSGEIDISSAAIALRVGIVDFVFYSLANCFKNYYQGSSHKAMTYILTVLEAFAFSAIAVVPLTMSFGVYGTCAVYAVGDILTIITLYIVVCVKNKSGSFRIENFLLLSKESFISDENVYRSSPTTFEEVEKTALEVQEFIKSKDGEQNKKLPENMRLCVEELCSNILKYGFTDEKKRHKKHMEVSVMVKEGKFTLRIRDDCQQYNPVEYYEKYEKDNNITMSDKYGLEIVFGLMEDVNYLDTLGLNSVVITG
ncbi:MAG: ATP-binding protein [Lachnospiraceae bacterium]|nr:ATP-binding protein [Lachnospiraceae bacterium]